MQSLMDQSRERCFDGNERLSRWYYPVEGGDRTFQLFDPSNAGYSTRTFRGDQYARISSGISERVFGSECLFNELASDPNGLEYAQEFDIDEDGALILAADETDPGEEQQQEPVDMLQRMADEVANFGTRPEDFVTLEDIQRLAYTNNNALDTHTRCDRQAPRPTVQGNWA
jgi:hypothetical protein